MKTRNRILSVILAIVLCVGMLPTIILTAFAADAVNVKYIDENGVEQTCSSATVVENAYSMVEWSDGWYVVNSDVTISDTSTVTHLAVKVTGNVHLILADGCTLTVEGYIYGVDDSSSLTIYGQSLGTGKLDVTTTIDSSVAAMFFKDGSLTINSGTIKVTNTMYNTGDGWGIDAKNLTINGGTITAEAGSPIKSDNAKYYGGTVTTIDSNNGDATETKTYCSVNFDANGGAAVEKVGSEVGGTINTLPATARDGYEFKGWYMPDGTTKVTTETIFSADTTVTAKWLEIPTAEDFVFTPPANLTYDGVPKTATVTVKDGIVGMGEITVKYEPVGAINADTYIVKIDVTEGTAYAAANAITDASWTFTIGKQTPTVDPKPTASRVVIGGKLSDSILTGGVASVPGTFDWKDGTEVLDTAETVTRKVVFTPDDLDNYNTVEIDVDVTVVLCDTASGDHDYTALKHDDKNHWYECVKCGNVKADSKTAHTFEWKVDKEPTASETGLKHEECSCGAKRNIDTDIPKTETDSPQTDDNRNAALWFFSALVICFGIVVTTACGRKKRREG